MTLESDASHIIDVSHREDQRALFLTVKEFAERHGVHIQTVYSAIRHGRLKFPVRRVSDGGRIEILIDANGYSGAELGSPMGVYFLASGPFIKIGMSVDVVHRVRAISQATPHDVEPLGFIPAGSPREACEIERAWHQRFAEYRHRPEWFHRSEALLLAIKSEASAWPVVSRGSISAQHKHVE